MNDLITSKTLPLWAAARSIYGCGVECLSAKNSQSLVPRILPSGEFSFGASLIFSPKSFVKVIEGGFALPKISYFLTAPTGTFRSVINLARVGKVYRSPSQIKEIHGMLNGSLEAICCYLNHHLVAKKAFHDESSRTLTFEIKGMQRKWLIKMDGSNGWQVGACSSLDRASACLAFNDIEVAKNAALGALDSWLSLTNAEIILSGRIPLLDKFGYVSRIAQNEVPRPGR
ncbi:hypothetical protein OAV01_01485 [Opitutales bacterium]|nr:hypothetical protein [Opitutales bacterium]